MSRDHTRAEFEQFVADSADDLLRIARRWPRVRSMDHPKAYAKRVLVNLALDGTGRRNRQRSELDVRNHSSLDQRRDDAAALALGIVETTSELIDALSVLAPRQRATLVLRYFEDLSEAEAARVLGCSVGTVKSTTSRALERLRQILESSRAGAVGDGAPRPTDGKGATAHESATRL